MKNRAPIAPGVPISLFVPEDSVAGHTIVDLHSYAFDPNDGDTLFFTILNGNDFGQFYIDSEGRLMVGNIELNFEVESRFPLKINVIDAAGLIDTFDVIVHVTNRNDAPHIVTYELDVLENSVNGIVVGTIEVFDEDNRNQDMAYSILSGNDADAFDIDSAGTITVANPSALNFESATTTFDLNIQVQDTSSNFGAKSFTTANIIGTLGGNWSKKLARVPSCIGRWGNYTISKC
jgi:hypothetical protein